MRRYLAVSGADNIIPFATQKVVQQVGSMYVFFYYQEGPLMIYSASVHSFDPDLFDNWLLLIAHQNAAMPIHRHYGCRALGQFEQTGNHYPDLTVSKQVIIKSLYSWIR
jgi:hypothetical protein